MTPRQEVESAPRLPLAGIGVLVTRPARQAGGFAQKLAALGANPVVFPAIVILPPANTESLERAQATLRDYDFAVFVSGNAVEYGVSDPQNWPATLIAMAPGPGTAEALAAIGIAGVRIPETTFDSSGLLALPEFARVGGKRVAIFRGSGGRDELGETLRARGARVDYIECYRRARPQSGASGLVEAFLDGRIDAVAISSSEGLDNLWAVVTGAARAAWQSCATFVPHPRIAAKARELGLDVIETASTDAGLIAGLLEWAAQSPRRT
jgi:uroporphyrinogen-III synthase